MGGKGSALAPSRIFRMQIVEIERFHACGPYLSRGPKRGSCSTDQASSSWTSSVALRNSWKRPDSTWVSRNWAVRHPMSSSVSNSVSKRTTTRGAQIARAGALVAVIVCVAGAYRYHSVSVAATAEREAREFILMNGCTNEGSTHTLLSEVMRLVPRAPNSKPIGYRSLTGVCIPRDRLTDHMARHLLNIPNLDCITLYPANPDGNGLDFKATVITTASSLSDLDLPLSPGSITMLERRLPNTRIDIAKRPATIPNP